MKRTIKKQFWLTREEAKELEGKAKRTCLTEASLLRLLIKGFEPKEKPDDRFYDVMRELNAIGNRFNQIAIKANALGFIDAPMLEKEIEKLNQFQLKVERHFLTPEKNKDKWQ